MPGNRGTFTEQMQRLTPSQQLAALRELEALEETTVSEQDWTRVLRSNWLDSIAILSLAAIPPRIAVPAAVVYLILRAFLSLRKTSIA